jgi:hypothetical protein
VIQQWHDSHTLPSAEEAGLPAAGASIQTPAQKPPKPKRWWQL